MSYYGASGSNYYYGACFSRRSGFSYTDLVLFKGRLLGAHRKWQNGVDVGPSRWQVHLGEGNTTLSGNWGTSVLPRVTGTSNYDLDNSESGRLGYVDDWMIEAPLYFPTFSFALLLSVYPVATRCRRRMRSRKGLCVECGYDLRGSKERCPECGREFEAPKPVPNGRRPNTEDFFS